MIRLLLLGLGLPWIGLFLVSVAVAEALKSVT